MNFASDVASCKTLRHFLRTNSVLAPSRSSRSSSKPVAPFRRSWSEFGRRCQHSEVANPTFLLSFKLKELTTCTIKIEQLLESPLLNQSLSLAADVVFKSQICFSYSLNSPLSYLKKLVTYRQERREEGDRSRSIFA